MLTPLYNDKIQQIEPTEVKKIQGGNEFLILYIKKCQALTIHRHGTPQLLK